MTRAVPQWREVPTGEAGSQSPASRTGSDQEHGESHPNLGITDKYQDVDPGKALLEEISVTYAHVQWLREKVAEIEGNQLGLGSQPERGCRRPRYQTEGSAFMVVLSMGPP